MQVGQWGAAASIASGVRSNEALGPDGRAFTEQIVVIVTRCLPFRCVRSGH